MTRWFHLALLMCVVAPCCKAQIDLLTLAESEEILETLPQFKLSDRPGECPGFDLLESSSRAFSLQVRGECPPDGFTGSMLVGAFKVDRRSGAVDSWPSGLPIEEPPETRVLAGALVERAKARALTPRETECLARQVVSGGLSVGESISVAPTNSGTDPRVTQFVVRYGLARTGLSAIRNVWVDRGSIAVLESPNGPRIRSLSGVETAYRMRAVRSPASLSVAEVIEVVSQVPSISARISSRCSLLSAESEAGHKRFITVDDTCQALPRAFRVIGVVDVLTGSVTDPRTHRVLDTPESIELARKLLQDASERLMTLKRQISAVCP